MVVSTFFLASTLAIGALVNGASLPVHLTRDVEPTCAWKDQGVTFTYVSGSTFGITCGSDYLGGDLRSFQAATLKDCLVACDGDSACLTVSYTNNICYLKSQLTVAISNSNVWAAKKQNAKSALSCADKADNGKTYQASKGQFKIICGQEYGGGDLTSTTTASFEACIEACATNTQCIDVSYVIDHELAPY